MRYLALAFIVCFSPIARAVNLNSVVAPDGQGWFVQDNVTIYLRAAVGLGTTNGVYTVYGTRTVAGTTTVTTAELVLGTITVSGGAASNVSMGIFSGGPGGAGGNWGCGNGNGSPWRFVGAYETFSHVSTCSMQVTRVTKAGVEHAFTAGASLTMTADFYFSRTGYTAPIAANLTEYLDITLGSGPPAARLKITTKGNYFLATGAVLTFGVVETDAHNSVRSVAPMAIGATAPTSLAFTSGEISEPSPGYWTGKSVYARLASNGTILAEVAGEIIPAPEAGLSEVEINFGDFGKQAPVVTAPPVATPTNTGNQQVVAPPVASPAPSVTGSGKTTSSAVPTAAATSAAQPAVRSVVNNATTTISGTGTGATNQDIYNDVLSALMDGDKNTKPTAAPGGSSGPVADNSHDDLGELNQVGGKADLALNRVTQTKAGFSSVIATNNLNGFASTYGTSSGLTVGGFRVGSTTASLDIPFQSGPFAGGIALARQIILWGLSVCFVIGCISTIRGRA